jgi:hypothetical protein
MRMRIQSVTAYSESSNAEIRLDRYRVEGRLPRTASVAECIIGMNGMPDFHQTSRTASSLQPLQPLLPLQSVWPKQPARWRLSNDPRAADNAGT